MSESRVPLVLFVILALVASVWEAGAAQTTAAPQNVVYRGVPIDIDLPLNQEIRIHLNESIEVGVPVALTAKLDVASVHGVIYLTALQAFTSHRLAMRGSASGRIVLLDVSATLDTGTSNDIFIQTDGETAAIETEPPLTIAELMRYIARLTLAPRRPVSPLSQIRRTVLSIPQDSIYRDFAVGSTLLAAWRTDEWLALAVELRNQSDEPITLNPVAISGKWRAVGLQHGRLLPAGKRGSQTVIFLIGTHDAILGLHR